ncbi:MAG: aldo/keto reductase [Bryobacteraceae bacterium]|nr:aldo/keto reductase [Bryobacteraceae bacterium]
MQRRTFFTGAAAASLAAAQSTTASKLKPGDVPRRKFGKTGVDVSIIGQAGGRFPMISREEAKAVTLRAYELGLNYFDNARLYGNGVSEEIYGEVLAPHRKELFLTTKSALYSRQGAMEDLDKSLKALRTDYVDLWQIHQVGEMKEVEEIFGPKGSIEAFVQAKKDGKARFIGFTGHRDPAVHLEMLKRFKDYDTILMPLHPADPHYLSFEKQVLPVAIERGMGIQGMKSTANAKLLSVMAVRDCIRYVLSQPIHCLAVGCTTVGQIEDDVRIAKEFKPLNQTELSVLQKKAKGVSGAGLEDWKRSEERADSGMTYRDGLGLIQA